MFSRRSNTFGITILHIHVTLFVLQIFGITFWVFNFGLSHFAIQRWNMWRRKENLIEKSVAQLFFGCTFDALSVHRTCSVWRERCNCKGVWGGEEVQGSWGMPHVQPWHTQNMWEFPLFFALNCEYLIHFSLGSRLTYPNPNTSYELIVREEKVLTVKKERKNLHYYYVIMIGQNRWEKKK